MTRSIYEKILRYAKKIKSINYLGGKCAICNESNLFKLSFHHRDPNEKGFEYGDYSNSRWTKIQNELDKCDLLCHNCHRELHFNKSELKYGDRRRKNKSIYLEYSGGKCIKCGYNKCPASLVFHHRNRDEKSFSIGNASKKVNSISELDNRISDEIDKCDLLCQNCHCVEHSDIELFKKYKDIIYDKINDYKEIQAKIDRNMVYEMYSKGLSQKDIALYFAASNGAISDILKDYKIKNGLKIIYKARVNKELVYELYDKGVKQVNIIKELKISKGTVYRILKNRLEN